MQLPHRVGGHDWHSHIHQRKTTFDQCDECSQHVTESINKRQNSPQLQYWILTKFKLHADTSPEKRVGVGVTGVWGENNKDGQPHTSLPYL